MSAKRAEWPVVTDYSSVVGKFPDFFFRKRLRHPLKVLSKVIIFGPLEAINSGINLNLDFGFNHTV